MNKRALIYNVQAIKDYEDRDFRRKIGYLQRYVKSLGKKLYQKIQKDGVFEKAGQKEIQLAKSRLEKYRLNKHEQISDFIMFEIKTYFNSIGKGDEINQNWKILG